MSPVGSLATAAATSTGSFLASILAATGTTDIGPWAQVGGTATAVGALAYVAKLLADGRLVAQPVAEIAASSARREDQLADLIEKHKVLVQDSHERESDLRSLLLMAQRRSDER